MTFFKGHRRYLALYFLGASLLTQACVHRSYAPAKSSVHQKQLSVVNLEQWLGHLNELARSRVGRGATIGSPWQAWSSSERLSLAIYWWSHDKEALQLGVIGQLLDSVVEDEQASLRERNFSRWLLELYSVNAKQLEELAQAQAQNVILKEKIEALSSIEKNLERRSR